MLNLIGNWTNKCTLLCPSTSQYNSSSGRRRKGRREKAKQTAKTPHNTENKRTETRHPLRLSRCIQGAEPAAATGRNGNKQEPREIAIDNATKYYCTWVRQNKRRNEKHHSSLRISTARVTPFIRATGREGSRSQEKPLRSIAAFLPRRAYSPEPTGALLTDSRRA